MPPSPRVAVVIVSYNVAPHLRRCLTSLYRYAGLPAEVVVVDNGSADGSAELVRSDFGAAALIARADNAGFARAANEGARATEAPYLFFLNPDTVVHDGALPALAAFLDAHPRAAVVAPRLHTPAGRLESTLRDEPTAFNLLREHLPLFRRRAARWDRHERRRRADWIVGAALLVRRAAFDAVGGFDERFPLYYEDADLCLRLGDAGYECWLEPAARITHYGGASALAAFGSAAEVRLRYLAARDALIRRRRGAAAATRYRLGQAVFLAGRWLGAALRGDRDAQAFVRRAWEVTRGKNKPPATRAAGA
jgi:hypothetical protein